MPEPTEKPILTRLGDLLGLWEADATAAHQARLSGIPRGPVTGLEKLDRDLGGALEQGVHVVHGQPGAGKTAFALQVAVNCGAPALFVSCEMSALELLRRVTARTTNTYLGRLKSGEFTPVDSLALAKQAVSACPSFYLCDATKAPAPPQYLLDIANGLPPGLLIVVDSVHSWAEAIGGGESEYEALNYGLAALRGLASTLNCPVLGVAERNRMSMKAGGMSAGAGTRKIEYGAETVMDLKREESSSPDAAGEVPITLVFAKNRNGAAGKKVELKFHGALQRFREV